MIITEEIKANEILLTRVRDRFADYNVLPTANRTLKSCGRVRVPLSLDVVENTKIVDISWKVLRSGGSRGREARPSKSFFIFMQFLANTK